MYPPLPRRRRGEDPIADFLDDNPPLESAKELEGTIFADPIRDFLLSQPIEKPKNVQAVDSAVDWLTTPVMGLRDKARAFADRLMPKGTPEEELRFPIPTPFGTIRPTTRAAKAFVGGVAEGAAEQASPFNIATIAASPVTRSASAVGTLARMGEAGIGGFQSGMGIPGTIDAIERGDWKDAAIQGGMTAMGVLGAGLSLLPPPPKPAPPPYDGPGRARVRDSGIPGDLVTTRRQPAPPTDIIDGEIIPPTYPISATQRLLTAGNGGELGPGQYDMPPPPSRPPGPMDLDLGALRQQFVDAVVSGDMDTANALAADLRRRGFPLQGLLPESTDGPIVTPPPDGSLPPDPPRYGADVRWQHPQNPATPSAGPAAAAGPSGASPAPAAVAPSSPNASVFTPDELAYMKRQGFSDEMIARLAGGQVRTAPDPRNTVIQPDALINQLPPLDERMAAARNRRPPTDPPPPAGAAPVAPQPPDGPAPVSGSQAPPAPPSDDPLARLLGMVEEAKNANPADVYADQVTDPTLDPLTGLGNRIPFERRKGERGRLFGRIDLDNFKAVNDALGHDAGDRVLQIVSDTLRQFTRRSGDLAARLGGDEFGLNLEAPSDPAATVQLRDSIENAIATALADAGFGEVAGRKIAASLGFGADEAAADAAAIARKAERGVSQPRVDGAPRAGVESAPQTGTTDGNTPDPGLGLAGNPPADGSGPLAPGGDRLRPAPTSPAKGSAAADNLWQEFLDDARSQGFDGTDDDLRSIFNERVKSAQDFIEDMAGLDEENDLFRIIREQGGLDPSYFAGPNGERSEEIRSLIELLDLAGLKGKNSIIRTGAGANQQAQRVNARAHKMLADAQAKFDAGKIDAAELARVKAEASALAGKSIGGRPGQSLDDLATYIRDNHADKGIASDWQLLEALKAAARQKIDDTGKKWDLRDVLENGVGTRKGSRWWEDGGDDSFDVTIDRDFEDGLDEAVNSLPADPDNPDYVRVPFEVADNETMNAIAAGADYSNPTLERVPIRDLIATQPTATRDVVRTKLQSPRPELTEIPTGAYGAPRVEGPVVLRSPDGRLYLAGGTHETIARMLNGETDVQAVVYPTKGAGKARTTDPLEAMIDSMELVDDDGPTVNASGDSAASAEALSRQSGMRSRGEQFVVYDRAGNKRPLIGPDAVDYVAKNGETYGVEGPDGFRVLDDRGGKVKPADPLVDILDTGEAQPRLPGDVGSVRDNELPTPTEDLPFSLARQTADSPKPKQDALVALLDEPDGASGKLAPSGSPEAPVAPQPESPAPSDLPEPRHEVRSPKKVEALVQSMKEHGWQGRPVLVIRDGNTRVAWTATHRLDAAKRAGLKPSDVPTIEVDGAVLRAAGFDLDDLTAKGKKARIAALREAGLDDAAKLLEDEQVGSEARQNPPAGAADVEPVPDNVREFLVRQLGYTNEEVTALGRQGAVDLGNKVRMHPDGVSAGIAAHRKPKKTYRAEDPGPNLGEGSTRVESDELAKLLGIQERRTALQKTRVEPGEGQPPTPKLTPAQINKAVEMTRQFEREAPAAPGKVSQSDAAKAKSDMVQSARERAKLLDNPTPENLDRYVQLLGEAADRQLQRELKGGTSKEGTLKQHERTGEYLASGLGGLEKLYRENPAAFWTLMRTAGGGLLGALAADEDDGDDPLGYALAGAAAGAAGPKLWSMLRSKAPGVAKAIKDTLPPSLGGAKGGAPRGKVSPVRAPRDLSKDIGGSEQILYGQPHRTVPDVWKKISPIIEEMVEAERGLPSTTPRMIEFTRNLYVKEAVGEIRHAARQAKDQGLHRRAKYLEALVDELEETPTMIERLVADLTNGKIKPSHVNKALSGIETAMYVKLLGFALDTAILNRTQILLAYPHLGARALKEGVKAARTPEGQRATRFLNIEDPVDAPTNKGQRAKPSLIRKIVKLAMSPMRAADSRNRKEVYLGAMYHARRQGLDAKQAHEWAMEITTQTQGWPGELGANPFHRHLGPLRMFTKYPSIWAQFAADIISHPDPAVRRRGVMMMLGGGAVGAAVGINAMNILLPRLGISFPAAEAVADVASHVPGLNLLTGDPDHTMGDDLRSLKTYNRYGSKVLNETKDMHRYGFDTHPEFDRSGNPRGEHDAWDGFLSLLGFQSSDQADSTAARSEAYDDTADATRRRSIESRRNRQDLREAIESGASPEDVSEILQRMTPQQQRDFWTRNRKTPYQLMLERVPKTHRAEFERRYKDRLGGARGSDSTNQSR